MIIRQGGKFRTFIKLDGLQEREIKKITPYLDYIVFEIHGPLDKRHVPWSRIGGKSKRVSYWYRLFSDTSVVSIGVWHAQGGYWFEIVNNHPSQAFVYSVKCLFGNPQVREAGE